MAKIIYGYISFVLSILAALAAGTTIFLLFFLPPATYIFQQIFYLAWIPLIISLIGLLFYYIQSKIFVVTIVKAALIINFLVLITTMYFLYNLNLALVH